MAKQVKTGIQSESLIQIVDGLKEGDEIVTGSYRAISKDLVNGSTVAISKEPLKGLRRRPRVRMPVALQEAIPIAVGALRANKVRGSLTTARHHHRHRRGGAHDDRCQRAAEQVPRGFSSVGSDIIYVSRMPWVVMNDFFKYRNRPGIALREARVLEERFRGRAIVNPTVNGQRDVKYRNESMEGVIIIGTTEKQAVMSSALPRTGRFLLPFDVAYKRDVCVIGADIQKGLFGAVHPVNQTMKIGRTDFRVIGVMEKQGEASWVAPTSTGRSSSRSPRTCARSAAARGTRTSTSRSRRRGRRRSPISSTR